jgi:PST family polysaccharide transporter
MARILDARDFGVIALASVFIFFANLLVGHTFSDAIVQKKEVDRASLDTAFWGSILSSLLLALLLIVLARPLSAALGDSRIEDALYVLAAALPFGAVGNISASLYRRDLRFRPLAIYSVSGRALGAALGVGMALSGAGLWSLLGQQIAGSVFASTGIFVARGWWPGAAISRKRLSELLHFGAKVSAGQVVTGASEQLLNLLTGALFGTVILGHLNIAWRIIQLTRTLTSGAMYHVGFSAFSRLRDDPERLRRGFIEATQLSCLVGFAVAGLMVALANPLVTTLFGSGWSLAGTLLQLLSIELFAGFFSMFFSASYRAMGRPGLVLWVSLAYLAVGVMGALGFSWAGIVVVTVVWALRSFILMPLHLRFVKKVLCISPHVLLGAVFPIAMASLLLIGVSSLVHEFLAPHLFEIGTLAAAGISGIAAYVALITVAGRRVLLSGVRAISSAVRRE